MLITKSLTAGPHSVTNTVALRESHRGQQTIRHSPDHPNQTLIAIRAGKQPREAL